MTLQIINSTTAGATQDLSSRVSMASERLGLPSFTLTQNAEELSVSHSSMTVDDPSGNLTLKGHRRVYAVETAAPSGAQVIGNVYIGPKAISRGDWNVGPLARTFEVQLADANTLPSRRRMVGSDANRPAETDIARLTWLLSTTEANEFNGPTTYINDDSSFQMPAVDYRGQTAQQILDDLMQESGKNCWVVYFENVGRFGLWYDFPYSTAYSSTIRLSNDEVDVDDSTTFAYFHSSTWTQDPDRVYSGTLIDFQPAASETVSWVYEQQISTGNEFVFRDVAYPSQNVKTEAQARGRARRYNADSDTEEDVMHVTFVVPAAKVNELMHGMRIEFKGTHWGPGASGTADYTTFKWARALNRTVTQIAPTHYRIDAELSPVVTPAEPFLILYRPQTNPFTGATPQTIGWGCSGDPQPCSEATYGVQPTVGALATTAGTVTNTTAQYVGFTVSGTGTIDITAGFRAFTACGGITITVNLRKNGVTIASGSCVTPALDITITANDIAVAPGDAFTAQLTYGGPCIIYLDGVATNLTVTGGSLV